MNRDIPALLPQSVFSAMVQHLKAFTLRDVMNEIVLCQLTEIPRLISERIKALESKPPENEKKPGVAYEARTQ
jgi:hypothetical protein